MSLHDLPAEAMPFGKPATSALVLTAAEELCSALGLRPETRLVEGNARSGLELEARFRCHWWASGMDPLRLALHACKTAARETARVANRQQFLTEALCESQSHCMGPRWRERIQQLRAGRPEEDQIFLVRLFGAAQQAWTRSARWQAVMPPESCNPFLPLLRLFALGAWPLGIHGGQLWVYRWEPGRHPCGGEGPTLDDAGPGQPGVVFLCTLFREAELASAWVPALAARGWQVLHGEVDETVASPEPALGQRIRQARAVLALVPRADADFGLPWWIFQELDFARACGRPHAVACGEPRSALAHQGLRPECQRFPLSDPTEAASVWDWLGRLEPLA